MKNRLRMRPRFMTRLTAIIICFAVSGPDVARAQAAGDPALPAGVTSGSSVGSSAQVMIPGLGTTPAPAAPRVKPLARIKNLFGERKSRGESFGQSLMRPKGSTSSATSLGALGGSTPDGGGQSAESVAKLTPEREFEVHIDLGRVSESQGQFEQAVEQYKRALQVAPGRGSDARQRQALAHRKLAGALDRLGKFAEAAPHHEQAIQITPDDPKVWNDAGYSAYLQGDLATAETRLRRAATLAPDDPKIQNNLGLALGAVGKTDEALAALSRAVGPAAAHANLGYILAASGSTEGARSHYQKALRLRPDDELALAALARIDASDSVEQRGQPVATANPSRSTDSGIVRTVVPSVVPPPQPPPQRTQLPPLPR